MPNNNSNELFPTPKERVTAFVLGGGGARGALQAGALRALLEAGIQPDIVVGTSVGAINGAFLAVRGSKLKHLAELEDAWREADAYHILQPNYVWLALRVLFKRTGSDSVDRLRRFLIDHGLSPSLRFGDLHGARFLCVATDLRTGEIMLYGTDPDHLVLNAVLASTSLPPWGHPLRQDDCLLVDGGIVSNLPVESALSHGATRIIALDLSDPDRPNPDASGLAPLFVQLKIAMEQRHVYLEKQLAAVLQVPVHHIKLGVGTRLPIWDFGHADALFGPGYQITRQYLTEHPELTNGY